jgi:hypothetical protein
MCAMKAAGTVAIVLLALLIPAGAHAIVEPESVVDGPSNGILEMDGAAMAPDGSGGIVYRKDVNDVAHVFVDQFASGHWATPVEVDREDAYGASQPAIGAGEGGRLLVVWVQRRNVNPHGVDLYELMSASLQPGTSSFGGAIIVDPNVGEPYTGEANAVEPSLAMAPNGQAYVVYRVVTNGCGAGEQPDSLCVPSSSDVLMSVRVARFNYLSWSSLGAINRAPQVAMRAPTATNLPSIGIDLNGNAVVVWQEPENAGGVARIWVRRLFGVVQGNVLEASPGTLGGRPVTSDAEAPTVAVSPYGEARIAFRIKGTQGSAVTTTELFTNSIGSELDLKAALLNGAIPVPGAAEDDMGVPSASVDEEGAFQVTWSQGQNVRELGGTLDTTRSPVSIGSTTNQLTPTTVDPSGGGTTAWLASAGDAPTVDVRQDLSAGAFQQAQFGGTIPGPISGLSFGGSGRGDALLGWTVGKPGYSEVVGDFVQAPPADFDVVTPLSWVTPQNAIVSWEPALDAVAGVAYTVYVDGKPRAKGLTGLSTRLSPVGLGDGAHHVKVLATDASGQQRTSTESLLKIDADPPIVRVRLLDGGQSVRVTVTDDASGVDAGATAIAFGDGAHSHGRARAMHRYRIPGTFTITAQVRDNVGNHATVRLRVRVR